MLDFFKHVHLITVDWTLFASLVAAGYSRILRCLMHKLVYNFHDKNILYFEVCIFMLNNILSLPIFPIPTVVRLLFSLFRVDLFFLIRIVWVHSVVAECGIYVLILNEAVTFDKKGDRL